MGRFLGLLASTPRSRSGIKLDVNSSSHVRGVAWPHTTSDGRHRSDNSRMGLVIGLATLLLLSLSTSAQNSASTMIQRSAEANERDWLAAPSFDHSERDRDKNGDKAYAVTMMYGSPYQRLIALNGRPLIQPSNKKSRRNSRMKEFNESTNHPKRGRGESPSTRQNESATIR